MIHLSLNRDMPDQAREIIKKIKADPNLDMDNDWKMITLFIGGNNLCAICKDPVSVEQIF